MNHASIQARREKISYYLVKGIPESKIAELLGVHRNTVGRDVAYLKKSAKNWLDGLAKDGFIYEYRLTLEKIRDHERELQELLTQSDNIMQKLQILRALDDNSKLYLETLGGAPTISAYKRALNRLEQQQEPQNKKNDNNKQAQEKPGFV